MGLSLITALEIFTNPDDLYFAVIRDPKSGKYGLVIARGPGHDYKPLFDSCNYETREGVLEMLRTGLQGTREWFIKELSSSSSLVAAIFKPPAGQPLEEVGLTQVKVDEIIEMLTTRDTFLTARPNSTPADRLAETVELVEHIADATTT